MHVFFKSPPLWSEFGMILLCFRRCLFGQGWGKGVVFINGKNLGRYWSIGPQLTLYLPGPWLRSGNNQVVTRGVQVAQRHPSPRTALRSCCDLKQDNVWFLCMDLCIYFLFFIFCQVLVYEEQKTDGKIEFTSNPDYGKTEHVKWGRGGGEGHDGRTAGEHLRGHIAQMRPARQLCWPPRRAVNLRTDHQSIVNNPD